MSTTLSLLTDEQIRTLRVEWLDDFIDLMPQWGTPVAAAAAKGDQALALTGLASVGTLNAGTGFGLVHNGQAARYYMTADAVITSGAATISFAPPLIAAVLEGATVSPDHRRKSLFNKRTGRLFFSDPELQDLADRATKLRGRFVSSSDDPDFALFRAIRYYGWGAMLSSDEYLNAVLADDSRGTNKNILDAKGKQLLEDGKIVFADQTGPQNVRFVR